MTQLLKKAFQKISTELNKKEQDTLAELMLENDSHILIKEAKWLFRKGDDYNEETRQAIQDVVKDRNLTEHKNSNDLFHKLEI